VYKLDITALFYGGFLMESRRVGEKVKILNLATKAPSSPRQPKSKPKVFLRFKTKKKKLLFFSALLSASPPQR
jgi:hypothetical protein